MKPRIGGKAKFGFLPYILLLLTLISHVDCRADIIRTERFHYITKEDGLTGESVASIMVDINNRVWLATNDGVTMYNGKQLSAFRFSRTGSHPNYVYDICQGSDQTIYAVSGQGVFALRKGDSEFRLILEELPKAEAVFEQGGTLYVGNREGLYVYNGHKTKLITVGSSPMGIENSVRDITADGKGNIWFATRYAVNCYRPTIGTFRSYNVAKYMPEGAALSHFAFCGNLLYIGTKNNGLFVYNLQTGKLTPVKGIGNIITSVYANSRGEVCVSCDGMGASLIDGKTAVVKERFGVDAGNNHQIASDAVYCYMRTGNGTDWIGLYRYGVAHTYYSQPLFRVYTIGDFSTEGMNVRSFYIGKTEKVLGTAHGVYFVNEHNRTVHCVTPEQLGGAHIITNIYFWNDKYYIASYDAGVRVVDPHTFAVTTIADAPLLATTTANTFATDSNGRLWIGTAEGVFVLDKSGSINHYTENNSRLCRGGITGIYFDSRGNGWLSSEGLSLYVAGTRTFESSNFPKNFFNGESGLGISRGHDGMLLFNHQNHVFYSNISMSKFGEMTIPDEIVGGQNYAFLDDMRGYYWFATDNGLFRIDYQQSLLQHFGYDEGLRCQFVNVGGVKTDANGTVWVGTSNGLMYVDYKAMQKWQHNREFSTLLYNIRKGGDLTTYDVENEINSEHRIYLSWNIVSQKLSFRVVLLDYARQSGRLYQWRLDNNDKWYSVNDATDIELKGLLPGRHHIHVRLAGAPGTEAVYTIIVLPSLLAILECALLIIAGVLLLLWYRYHKNTRMLLHERDEIEGALIEVEQAQQNAEMQIQQLGEHNITADQTAQPATQTTDVQPVKYSKVRIDTAECADIVARMKAYIEEKRPFTNPELKMSDIADVLHLSSSRLSQIFSLYLGENYYEFINGYRLREFKRLIAEGAYHKFTLTALSEQCGFKKSSFFSTFRRVEGMTPTEYLKKQNIKL